MSEATREVKERVGEAAKKEGRAVQKPHTEAKQCDFTEPGSRTVESSSEGLAQVSNAPIVEAQPLGMVGQTVTQTPNDKGETAPLVAAEAEVVPEQRPEAVIAATGIAETTIGPRHPVLVRVTHWLTVLSFLALLVTGVEILFPHPRFYWGEAGNLNTRPLFKLHIPSSRDFVPTGYSYVLRDQNGWSRDLHFEAAWLLVLTGLLYLGFGLFGGHIRRNLLPALSDLSLRSLAADIGRHLRFQRPTEEEAWSYNVLQRLTYLLVIFVLFTLIIWTGLCMSPAFGSVFPSAVALLGGRQSARTIHFFIAVSLVLFLLVHMVMVYLGGFWKLVGTMITGRLAKRGERA